MALSTQSTPALFFAGQNATLWIKRAIIIQVILVAGFVVPEAMRGDRLDMALLMAVPLLIALLVLHQKPQIGFPLLVIFNFIIPSVIRTSTETSVSLSLILVAILIGLWLLEKIGRERTLRMVVTPLLLPVLGLMGVSLLSFVFGQIRWLPVQPVSIMAQLGGLAIFLLLPGLLLYTIERLRSPRILKWTTWLFIALGGIFTATLLLPNMRQYGFRFFQRAVYDSMFWTWLVTIAFSQSMLNRKLQPIWRIGLALVGLSAFYITIVLRQAWTSGWFPAVIAILTILTVKKPNWVLIGALILGVVLILRPEILDSVFLSGDNPYSLKTRLEAWRIIGGLLLLNPLLGLGPASYYNYTPLYDILGYSVRFNSHNNYVDIAAQVGLLGLFFFLWFAWRLFWFLWNNREKMPEGFPRAFMYGALGGLIATLAAGMLGDWFLPFVYNIGMEGFRASSFAWFFLGAAVALVFIYSTPESSPGQDDHVTCTRTRLQGNRRPLP